MKEFIKKLQGLPEKQKLAIIVVVVILATVIMGYFWLTSSANSLSKIGQSVDSLNLPNMELPVVTTDDMPSPSPIPSVSPTPSVNPEVSPSPTLEIQSTN